MFPRYQVRQGDVLLVPIATLPPNLTPVPEDRGRVVLAYGEVTGHAHAFAGGAGVQLLTSPAPVTIRESTEPVMRFLQVDRLSHLVHEEHGTVTIGDDNVGAFAVITPREYTPWGDRAVLD